MFFSRPRFRAKLCDLLGIAYPILQSGMGCRGHKGLSNRRWPGAQDCSAASACSSQVRRVQWARFYVGLKH